MANAPGSADVVAQEPSCEGTCDVLCLVKRSGYELVVATPMRSPTCPSWEQVRVQVRLIQRGRRGSTSSRGGTWRRSIRT
jgi:hypothetical protein